MRSATLTENLRLKDKIEQSNNTMKGAIDAFIDELDKEASTLDNLKPSHVKREWLIRNKIILLTELKPLIEAEKQAEYSRGLKDGEEIGHSRNLEATIAHMESEKQAYAKQQVSEALEKVEQYVDSKYDLCAELCTYDGGKQEAAYDVLRFMKTLLSQYDNNKQGAQVER